MPVVQKWLLILAGLAGGAMVLANPDAVYKAAKSFRSLTAGSLVDVTTGGKGSVPA